MEPGHIVYSFQPLGIAIAEFLLLVIILPLGGALLLAVPVSATLALVTTTLVIEYGAAPVGLGLGLSPYFVLAVITSVAAGVILLLFGIFDTLGSHSGRVARFLDRSKSRVESSALLVKYGIFGLVPCVMFLGFYVCPVISWVLSWHRNYAIILTLAGYVIISSVTILATLGIFRIFGWGA